MAQQQQAGDWVSTEASPLGLLREACSTGQLQRVTSQGEHVVFRHCAPPIALPATAPVGWRSQQGVLYTLGDLIHFLRATQGAQSAAQAYSKAACEQAGVAFLSVIEQGAAAAFLTGRRPDYTGATDPAIAALQPAFQLAGGGGPAGAAPAWPASAGQASHHHPDSQGPPAKQLRTATGAAVPRAAAQQQTAVDVREVEKRERPTSTRASRITAGRDLHGAAMEALQRAGQQGGHHHANGAAAAAGQQDQQERKRTHAGAAAAAGGASHAAAPPASQSKQQGPAGQQSLLLHQKLAAKKLAPIVILPPSGPLTLSNAEAFLAHGKWQDPADAARLAGVARTGKLRVKLPLPDLGLTEVDLVDTAGARRLTPLEWYGVCAVFAAGPEWQFKNFPFDNFVALFAHARGFFLNLDKQQLPETVAKWNVKVLNLQKQRRHQDAEAQLNFLREFASFLCSGRHSHVSTQKKTL